MTVNGHIFMMIPLVKSLLMSSGMMDNDGSFVANHGSMKANDHYDGLSGSIPVGDWLNDDK